MNVQKNQKSVDQELTTEIELKDKVLKELYIKDGPRIDHKIKNAPDYLEGLRFRYSPKSQKKVFYIFYKYEGKSYKYKLGNFIPKVFGSVEVTEKVIQLRKKYYKDGRWKYNVQEELLLLEELQGKIQYKLNDVIKKVIPDEFPRITKVGKLDSGTQKTYTRFFIGAKRLKALSFRNDDKEYGRVSLKGFDTFDEYWKANPKIKKGKSVFDSNIGSAFIKDLDQGIIEMYVNEQYKEFGMKQNLVKALTYLFNYAQTYLKAFGSKGFPSGVNPAHDIKILQTDDVKFKGAEHNTYAFSKEQRLEVEAILKKDSDKFPFSTELILISGCTRIRPSEAFKLKKTDVKDHYINLRSKIQKDRSKGKQEDIKVYFEDERIVDILLKLKDHQKKHPQTQFSPWLFPNINQNFYYDDEGNEKPYNPRLETNSYLVRATWDNVRKQIGFTGAIKTLRKTYMTRGIEKKIQEGMAEEEAIKAVGSNTHKPGSKVIKKNYYRPDKTKTIKFAKELGQVLVMKRKS